MATVHDYDTAADLGGRCSRDLARASRAAGATGAVLAALIRGIWQHVPDSQESAYVQRGEAVRTVYVMD